MKEVSDLERLTGRLNLGSATPRDLNGIFRSLQQVPAIREALSAAECSLLQVLYESTDEMEDVRALIARSINDEPPAKLSDGDTIREGYSSELDELRSISRNAKQTIATLEAYRTHAQRHRLAAHSLTTTSLVISLRCQKPTRRACRRITNDGRRWRTLNDTRRRN